MFQTRVQHVTIDDMKKPDILEKVQAYTDTLDGNLSYPKYIYTESEFEGFIMDYYLLWQIDEVYTNKWEE